MKEELTEFVTGALLGLAAFSGAYGILYIAAGF